MFLTLNRMFICIGSIIGIFSKSRKNDTDANDENHTNFLCKFVTNGMGKRIGESISFHNDILIIKSGSRYMGVPIKHIEENGNSLVVKGLVDYSKAYEMGEQWRKKSYSNIE